MSKFSFLLAILTFLLASNHLIAQKEANIWYFGNYAGLDFNSGVPVGLVDGQLNTTEGCASIADAFGNLLFYTDGSLVWDRTHNIMPNGAGLLGHNSSTQSSIIIPKPGSNNIYYIFTVAVFGNSGLNYSEVDMTLNGALGDITTNKNIPLFTNTSEKVTAVLHNNNTDIWVINKEHNTPNYYSYLVTAAGVNSSPVTSIGGNSGLGSSGIGYMKASPDGSKIGVANRYINVELFDFDNNTGQLNFQLEIPNLNPPNSLGSYGLEFSPNSKACYWTEQGGGGSMIFQIDLTVGSNTNIINSKFVVDSSDLSHYGLQLGPDKKIYCANYQSDYMNAINDPNNIGPTCDYQSNVVFLPSGKNNLGLPTFFQSYFQDGFYSEFYCLGDSTQFTITNMNADSILWYFDDSSSGAANISTDFNPQHVFSDTGSYNVSLVIYKGGQWTSLTQLIVITTLPVINLGPDTLVCNNTTLILDASYPDANYLWSNNTTGPTLNISSSGIYSVTATTVGCRAVDSIDLLFIPCVFAVDSFCSGNPTLFNYNYNQADFVEWNFDDLFSGANNTSNLLDPEHIFSTSGSFDVALTVYQNNSSLQISQNVQILASPILDLGPDTSLCINESMILNAGVANTYVWNDHTTLQNFLVDSTGLYSVTVSNNNCSSTDSILINYINCVPCEVSLPNAFSPNKDGMNDTFAPITSGNCTFRQYRLEIYNRWGQKVYTSEDINSSWDGRFQGVEQAQEVYLYLLYYNLDNGIDIREKHTRGQVTLLR